MILCGGSAYPRTVETWEFRKIADEVGALLWCDMAHFSGLVAAGLHPNPMVDCDVVTSTTHKTLAGPRAGFILCREEHASAIDRAVFPGLQGGPLEHAIAAKATCFRIAASDGVPRLPDAGARERRRARRRDHRRRARRADRRHRHPPPAARPAPHGVDGQGRRGAAARRQADDEPQHGAVRRAAADGGLGRADRDARRRRCAASTRTTSARSAGSSSVRSPTAPTSRPSRHGARRSAHERPLYPGFRGYTRYDDVTAARSSRSTIRSSGTSSACCATSRRRRRCSVSSSTS